MYEGLVQGFSFLDDVPNQMLPTGEDELLKDQGLNEKVIPKTDGD